MNAVSARPASRVRAAVLALVFVVGVPAGSARAEGPAVATGVHFPQISQEDAREWLTYLSSDLLDGREVFTEGYGLAAAYVADHLRQWGVKPLGDEGSYFQIVKEHGYRVLRNSSVTVEANGQSRTFTDGDHVTFPIQAGGKQTVVFTSVAFAGYGRTPAAGQTPDDDFNGRDVGGQLVMFLPGNPHVPTGAALARLGNGPTAAARSQAILDSLHAGAVMTLGASMTPAPDQAAAANRTAPRGGRGGNWADFTTVENVDKIMSPSVIGDQAFYDFLFTAARRNFDDVRTGAERGTALSPFTLDHVKVTITVNNTYEVTSTERTRNVVGMVEGTDPALKATYVLIGAHLDHVGYSHAGEPKGQVNVPVAEDPIWNGADDDGSGSTAVMAMAKAFATGPRPKRSVVFIWHAGRGGRAAGLALHGGFPGGAARQSAGRAQHRHDRPQPRRQGVGGQHGLRHRRRPHQHGPAQPRHPRRMPRSPRPCTSTSNTTTRTTPTASTRGAITTATRRRASRSRSSLRARTPTTTPIPIRWTRSCSRSSCGSRR